MKVLARHNIRQISRMPFKMAIISIVIGVLCMFVCISLNLRRTALSNLQLLKEEFDVVAIPTFSGSVNTQGELVFDVTSHDYQGYLRTHAENFDVSIIENAVGVKNVLVHKQYGAYLKNEDNMVPGNAQSRNTDDVVVFTYDGNEPLFLEPNTSQDVDITVRWSARGYEDLPEFSRGMKIKNDVKVHGVENAWSKALNKMNIEDVWQKNDIGKLTGAFLLQPGQDYIACVNWGLVTSEHNGIYKKGSDMLHWIKINADAGHSKRVLHYTGGGFYAIADPGAYNVSFPCILPYDDGFWETEVGAYFADASEICRINGNSLPVVTTEDVSLCLPFYNENVYISSGRSFTEKDYQEGNKVCLVSRYLAEQNGWKIGHKLDISFFEALYGYNIRSVDVDTYYEPFIECYNADIDEYMLEQESIIFDQGLYEIVGFYDGNVTRSDFSMDTQYTKEEGVDRRMIFVPGKSVQNQPEVPLSNYNTTILLDDEQTMYFMSDMEASGLMEQKKGQYQVTFEIFDQGYGAIKQSLRQLDTVSRLTLYLACAAAVVVIILLAVLTVLQNRRQIATLRSLGVRKRQIPAAVLSGVLLVCLVGAIAGGVLGNVLSERVAEYILDTAQLDLSDTAFSVMLAKEDMEEEDHYAIAIQSQPDIAVFASAAVLLALAAMCSILVLLEAGKSPMLILGAKE